MKSEGEPIKGIILVVGKACKAIFQPNPGFKVETLTALDSQQTTLTLKKNKPQKTTNF